MISFHSTLLPLRLLRSGLLMFAALVAFVALMTMSQPAHAQTTGTPIDTSKINLTPGECDPSMRLLNSILSGGSGNGAKDPTTGCSKDPYIWKSGKAESGPAKLFLYFNSLVLIFGGALLVYVVVMGTMKSAEDGEVLGKQWSTVWVPARVSVGFLALFPTSSGFSWVQIAVIWLAGQGVGAGNYLWSNTVTSIVDNQGDMVAVRLAEQGGVANIMRSILKSEVCIRDLNLKVNGGTNPSGPSQATNPLYAFALQPYTGGGGRFNWGNVNYPTNGEAWDVCGSVDLRSSESFTGAKLDSVKDIIWGGSDVRTAQEAVQSAQVAGLLAARDSMVPLANQLADPRTYASVTNEQIVATVAKATGAYRAAVGDRANKTLSGVMTKMTDGFKRDAVENGWIVAGAWYYHMARINSQINELATYIPKVVEPFAEDGDAIMGMTAHLSEKVDKAFSSEDARKVAWDAYSPGLERSNLNNVTNRMSNSTSRFVYEFFSVDPGNNTHAIVQLKNVGDWIIGSIESVILAKAVAESTPLGKAASTTEKIAGEAAKAMPESGFFGKVLSKLIGGDSAGNAAFVFGMLLLLTVFVGAVMLAFWIPVSPFIIWIGGVFGWVVSILEMIVAAPLWAAAHLHPEGEGMAGKYGASGYMIILEVTLRPILMVCGLILAFVVVDPFLRFMSGSFFRAMTNANGDSLSGLVTIVAFVCIYVGLCLTIVHRAFALIHLVPNAVLKWIGAHQNSYDNGDVADHIQGAVVGYLRTAGQAGTKAAPGLAMGGEAKKKLTGGDAEKGGRAQKPSANTD